MLVYNQDNTMTSIDKFNKSLFNFIDTQYKESIDELLDLTDAVWEMLGEPPEAFFDMQEITFS